MIFGVTMSVDKELFRRTKDASWSIMVYRYGDGFAGAETVYGHHHGCFKGTTKAAQSWFIGDDGWCYNCKVKVPDYIQALIRLYEGR